MESQALRQLVSEIFGNKETKEAFIKDPESFISRYMLTAQEKRAVLNTHARLGLVNGDSLVLDDTIGPMAMWI